MARRSNRKRRRGTPSVANISVLPTRSALAHEINRIDSLQPTYDIDEIFRRSDVQSRLATEHAVHAYPERVRQLNRTPRHLIPKVYRPKATLVGLPSLKRVTKVKKKLKKVASRRSKVLPVAATLSALRSAICAHRSIRTEVMHAIGKAGRKGQRSPVWKKSSKVRC